MKNFLIAILFLLSFSFVATAREYNSDQTKTCQDGLLCDLEDNLLTGTVKEYDKNENLKSETAFFKGRKNGGFKTYYTNGNLKSEGHYVYGTKVGKVRKYYENSQIIFKKKNKKKY